MTIFGLLLLLIVVKSARVAEIGEFHLDYMEKSRNACIKGIFSILIIMSHYSQYISLNGTYDTTYAQVRTHLNQAVVVMFLFYSGYGMMESIRKKGFEYVRRIPVRRFLSVLARFDFAILFFLIVQSFFGNEYPIYRILLTLVGWDGIGNSNWYIFGILGEYLLIYVSFLGMKKYNSTHFNYVYCTIFTILTAAFVCLLRYAGKDDYWYNTLLIFPMGTWYSLLRPRIERIVMKSDFTYMVFVLMAVVVYCWSYFHRWDLGLKVYTVWVAMFAALVVMLTMKIAIESPFLRWFGDHVFSFFILQRIPMIILSHVGYITQHKYAGFVIVFIATMVIAYMFDWFTGSLWNWLWKKPKHTIS